jgi:uncharacterized surface protein with fasciclin (FAS1) repeats
MASEERLSVPRQSWCTMLFKCCIGKAVAKQTVETKRSTATEESAEVENKPKEQAIDKEEPKEQAIDKEKNMENWVEEVNALDRQPSTDDAAPAGSSDKVNDDVHAPIVKDASLIVKESVPSTLGEGISTTDEEIGILAMFKDINEKFPNLYTAPAQAYMNAAFSEVFRTYTTTVQNVNEQEITRDLTETDEQFGMTAMFRELGEQFPDTSLTDPNAYINAMCAQLLRVYYTTALKASTVPAILQCNAEVVELDEDVGPHAMMKEVAGHFPGLSAFEAQQYMLCRFTELSSEAEKRRAEF